MGRQEAIARSIVLALIDGSQKRASSVVSWILAFFSAFFSLWQLHFDKIRPADFARLRRDHWDVSDDAYLDSFRPPAGKKPEDSLKPIGDMGFSGSTFYSTADQKYLVKSVPRHSEHSFFRDDLLTPYVQHMAAHSRSTLVRISDFVGSRRLSLGKILRLAPTHHIVMENIMYGQSEAKARGDVEWERWDLKPTSYFYPERDIADGRLTSEATKSQLADEFPDKIVLSKDQADQLFSSLESDTELLAKYNAVDYSLFLVRINTQRGEAERVAGRDQESPTGQSVIPQDPPAVPPEPPSWRTGVPSADGKHVYRAAVLDFFWAKHKIQPILMTWLINAWNLLIHHHGPMSITTTPDEYRQRFLKMCRKYVEVRE
ncbi:SAICAR synthase-like protein [Coniochaeta hoffmannii]|uniref:SAICAR synthase-like protein n=1 Tax=Coniochaeta hoffmannii TaxID=91930 RepID=A0AA38RF93_9PEZI|nr:SAICAR synthase-like protein [Coniochaeta hoffmannii]